MPLNPPDVRVLDLLQKQMAANRAQAKRERDLANVDRWVPPPPPAGIHSRYDDLRPHEGGTTTPIGSALPIPKGQGRNDGF